MLWARVAKIEIPDQVRNDRLKTFYGATFSFHVKENEEIKANKSHSPKTVPRAP
mgnify:CR=1 FL=1